MIKICQTCKQEFKTRPSRVGKYCSHSCTAKSTHNLNLDKDVCRALRYKQLAHEESEASKLRDSGYQVFSPTVVCDRIAVKDGKVYFVEFKRVGQKLRAGQQTIHDLTPDNYLIIYK